MLDPSGVLECVHAWAASAVQCHPYSSALPPVVDAWGQWLQMRITDACGTESVPVNCGVVAFLDGFDATTKGTYNTALQRLAVRTSRQYDTPFVANCMSCCVRLHEPCYVRGVVVGRLHKRAQGGVMRACRRLFNYSDGVNVYCVRVRWSFVCLFVYLFYCFIASRSSGNKVHTDTQTHTDTHRHTQTHTDTHKQTHMWSSVLSNTLLSVRAAPQAFKPPWCYP